MNIMQTRWHATAEHTDMACNARQKKVQTQPGHGNARSARTKQCNVWCRKQCVCVWCCVCCAVQGCQWITLCQHSPALAVLVLAVGSVVCNSKENNNRENNTEDAVDQ